MKVVYFILLGLNFHFSALTHPRDHIVGSIIVNPQYSCTLACCTHYSRASQSSPAWASAGFIQVRLDRPCFSSYPAHLYQGSSHGTASAYTCATCKCRVVSAPRTTSDHCGGGSQGINSFPLFPSNGWFWNTIQNSALGYLVLGIQVASCFYYMSLYWHSFLPPFLSATPPPPNIYVHKYWGLH